MIPLLDPNDSRPFRNNYMSAMMRARICCGRASLARSRDACCLERASQASTGLARAKKKDLPAGKFSGYVICRV